MAVAQANILSFKDQRVDVSPGRRVYHATPLHYLPLILQTPALISAVSGRRLGIEPRSSACRRDRMLGLDRYVHFAFERLTPLLVDKLAKGMPHALLAFDYAVVSRENAGRCGLLPFNTKAWRSRCCYEPVTDPEEMDALLRRHDYFGRCASLELIVEGSVSLDALSGIELYCKRDEVIVEEMISSVYPQYAGKLSLSFLNGYAVRPIPETQEYYRECVAVGCALPPPRIVFD